MKTIKPKVDFLFAKKIHLAILILAIVSTLLLTSQFYSPSSKQIFNIRAGQKMKAYGVESVPVSEITNIGKKLTVNLVIVEFNLNDSEKNWQKILDEASSNNLKVVVKLVPPPWHWTGEPKDETIGEWNLTEAEKFLNFLNKYLKNGNETIFSLYLLYDPFWRGHPSLGYSSLVQKKLYQEIKNRVSKIALWSDIGSLTFWENYSLSTRIENGMFDYAGIWLYPFNEVGSIGDVLVRIEEDAKLVKEKGLSLKLAFKIQTFSQTAMTAYNPPYLQGSNFYIPESQALEDLGCQVLQSNQADVVVYNSWRNNLYSDYLANHPELWDKINWLLNNCQG